MTNKNQFNYIGIVTLIISVLVLGLLIPQTLNQSNKEDDVIRLSSTAQREVSPDKARITFSIVSESEDLQEAISENTQINNKIMQEYSDNSDFTIESKSYRVYPKEKWNKDTQEYENTGYEVSNTIELTTQKLELSNDAVINIINLGANRVNSFEYTLTQESTRKIQDELIEEAYTNAEERARVVASLMNKEIVDVKSIEPGNFYYPVTYNRMYAEAKVTSDMAGNADSIDFAPESQSVTMNVAVEFEIE